VDGQDPKQTDVRIKSLYKSIPRRIQALLKSCSNLTKHFEVCITLNFSRPICYFCL